MRLAPVPMSTEHETDADCADAPKARKPYSPPALIQFGTILELTRSGQAGLPEDRVANGLPSA